MLRIYSRWNSHAGIAITAGYLVLLLLVIARSRTVILSQQTTTVAIIGILAGAGASVGCRLLKGTVRSGVIAALGALILVLGVLLSERMGLSGLWIVYGARNGALAVALMFTLSSLGLLFAFSERWTSAPLRIALGSVGGLAVLLYVIPTLVGLTSEKGTRTGFAAMLTRGDVLVSLFTIGTLGALMTVGTAAVTAAVWPIVSRRAARIGAIAIHAMFWLLVTMVSVATLVALFPTESRMRPEIGGGMRHALALLTSVAVGIVPAVAAAILLIGGLREVSILAADALDRVRGPVAVLSSLDTPMPPAATQGVERSARVRETLLSGDALDEQLRRLKQWCDEGLIGQEEYEQKRKDVLSRL